MHLEIYGQRPDVKAVVHAHPPIATSFAASGLSLKECLLAETALLLGEVPLAPYATPSTAEVPASIRDLVCCCDAVLLSNHGAVTYGGSLKEAHFKMETLEHSARVTFYARQLGHPNPLTREQLSALARLKESTYGLHTKTPGVEVQSERAENGEACVDRFTGLTSRQIEQLIEQAAEMVVARLVK
jgi:L-fuculose-phosphate aldolase